MRKSNAFLDVVAKQFVATPRISAGGAEFHALGGVRYPQRAAGDSAREDWTEHCANEPFSPCGEARMLWTLGARLAACLLALWLSLPGQAAVHEVGGVGLTVGDLPRQIEFYTNVLGFELVKQTETDPGTSADLFQVPRNRAKVAELRLGNERITLTAHSRIGRRIPPDSRSHDHWFQHIAIVVRDMDEAYAHLRRHNIKHVSTAPQTLPEWNPNAGGIKAFYFRDPEDHVLEVIWFPPGKGDPKWQKPTGRLFLGIDHTAIVVSDTERSLRFYRDELGMRLVGHSENYGVEQEHLNQVFGARLRITALRAECGPGIEFLEYIAPPGGRPLHSDAQANDLLFWTTELLADSTEYREAKRLTPRPVDTLGGRVAILRDRDGHALRVRATNTALSSR